MPRSITQLANNYVQLFGAQNIVQYILKAETRISHTEFLPVTNPILQFLTQGMRHNDRLFWANFRGSPDPRAYFVFNQLGYLLGKLRDEIQANPSFKHHIERKIFSLQEGPMQGVLSELFVAGYYKSIGKSIVFPEGEGMPDIDLPNTRYATDVKIFPNRRLRLEAMLNESGRIIFDNFRHFNNNDFLIFIFSPDKQAFQNSIRLASAHLSETGIAGYRDENLSIVGAPDGYRAGDYRIIIQPQNTRVILQANWPFDDYIEEFRNSITHSVEQAQRLNKKAITWVMFPKDAIRDGMEMTILRVAGIGYPLLQSLEHLYVMPCYSFEHREGSQIARAHDIFQHGQNTFGITNESIIAYFEEFVSLREILIPI